MGGGEREHTPDTAVPFVKQHGAHRQTTAQTAVQRWMVFEMALGYAFLILFIGFIYLLIRYPLIVFVAFIIATIYSIIEWLFYER